MPIYLDDEGNDLSTPPTYLNDQGEPEGLPSPPTYDLPAIQKQVSSYSPSGSPEPGILGTLAELPSSLTFEGLGLPDRLVGKGVGKVVGGAADWLEPELDPAQTEALRASAQRLTSGQATPAAEAIQAVFPKDPFGPKPGIAPHFEEAGRAGAEFVGNVALSPWTWATLGAGPVLKQASVAMRTASALLSTIWAASMGSALPEETRAIWETYERKNPKSAARLMAMAKAKDPTLLTIATSPLGVYRAVSGLSEQEGEPGWTPELTGATTRLLLTGAGTALATKHAAREVGNARALEWAGREGYQVRWEEAPPGTPKPGGKPSVPGEGRWVVYKDNSPLPVGEGLGKPREPGSLKVEGVGFSSLADAQEHVVGVFKRLQREAKALKEEALPPRPAPEAAPEPSPEAALQEAADLAQREALLQKLRAGQVERTNLTPRVPSEELPARPERTQEALMVDPDTGETIWTPEAVQEIKDAGAPTRPLAPMQGWEAEVAKEIEGQGKQARRDQEQQGKLRAAEEERVRREQERLVQAQSGEDLLAAKGRKPTLTEPVEAARSKTEEQLAKRIEREQDKENVSRQLADFRASAEERLGMQPGESRGMTLDQLLETLERKETEGGSQGVLPQPPGAGVQGAAPGGPDLAGGLPPRPEGPAEGLPGRPPASRPGDLRPQAEGPAVVQGEGRGGQPGPQEGGAGEPPAPAAPGPVEESRAPWHRRDPWDKPTVLRAVQAAVEKFKAEGRLDPTELELADALVDPLGKGGAGTRLADRQDPLNSGRFRHAAKLARAELARLKAAPASGAAPVAKKGAYELARRGEQYVVKDPGGEVVSTHPDRQAAFREVVRRNREEGLEASPDDLELRPAEELPEPPGPSLAEGEKGELARSMRENLPRAGEEQHEVGLSALAEDYPEAAAEVRAETKKNPAPHRKVLEGVHLVTQFLKNELSGRPDLVPPERLEAAKARLFYQMGKTRPVYGLTSSRMGEGAGPSHYALAREVWDEAKPEESLQDFKASLLAVHLHELLDHALAGEDTVHSGRGGMRPSDLSLEKAREMARGVGLPQPPAHPAQTHLTQGQKAEFVQRVLEAVVMGGAEASPAATRARAEKVGLGSQVGMSLTRKGGFLEPLLDSFWPDLTVEEVRGLAEAGRRFEERLVSEKGEREGLAADPDELPLHPDTREKNLRKWAEGTKVVDSSGKPLRVFHGTGQPGFREIDPSKLDQGALYGPGFYMTESPRVAGGRISTGWRLVKNGTPVAEFAKEEEASARRQIAERQKLYPDAIYNLEETEPALIPGYAHKGLPWDAQEKGVEAGGVYPLYAKITKPFRVDEDWDWDRAEELAGRAVGLLEKELAPFAREGDARALDYSRLRTEIQYTLQGAERDDAWRVLGLASGEGVRETGAPSGEAIKQAARKTLAKKLFGQDTIPDPFLRSESLEELGTAIYSEMSEAFPFSDSNNATMTGHELYKALEAGAKLAQRKLEALAPGNKARVWGDPLPEKPALFGKEHARGTVNHLLQELGFDGITHLGGKNREEQHRVWIAFRPEQVKSALNKGTFSPETRDILAADPDDLPLKPAEERWVHYGPAGLEKLSPSRFGSGAATRSDKRGLPVSYLYKEGTPLGADRRLMAGRTRYQADLSGLNLARGARAKEWALNPDREAADRALLAEGFDGGVFKTEDGREVAWIYKESGKEPSLTAAPKGQPDQLAADPDEIPLQLRKKVGPPPHEKAGDFAWRLYVTNLVGSLRTVLGNTASYAVESTLGTVGDALVAFKPAHRKAFKARLSAYSPTSLFSAFVDGFRLAKAAEPGKVPLSGSGEELRYLEDWAFRNVDEILTQKTFGGFGSDKAEQFTKTLTQRRRDIALNLLSLAGLLSERAQVDAALKVSLGPAMAEAGFKPGEYKEWLQAAGKRGEKAKVAVRVGEAMADARDLAWRQRPTRLDKSLYPEASNIAYKAMDLFNSLHPAGKFAAGTLLTPLPNSLLGNFFPGVIEAIPVVRSLPVTGTVRGKYRSEYLRLREKIMKGEKLGGEDTRRWENLRKQGFTSDEQWRRKALAGVTAAAVGLMFGLLSDDEEETKKPGQLATRTQEREFINLRSALGKYMPAFAAGQATARTYRDAERGDGAKALAGRFWSHYYAAFDALGLSQTRGASSSLMELAKSGDVAKGEVGANKVMGQIISTLVVPAILKGVASDPFFLGRNTTDYRPELPEKGDIPLVSSTGRAIKGRLGMEAGQPAIDPYSGLPRRTTDMLPLSGGGRVTTKLEGFLSNHAHQLRTPPYQLVPRQTGERSYDEALFAEWRRLLSAYEVPTRMGKMGVEELIDSDFSPFEKSAALEAVLPRMVAAARAKAEEAILKGEASFSERTLTGAAQKQEQLEAKKGMGLPKKLPRVGARLSAGERKRRERLLLEQLPTPPPD